MTLDDDPLTSHQVFGLRALSGVNTASLWEVWIAKAVAFGVGADMGRVVEVSHEAR